ncbi:unnamed protein product [Candida verbasci]|uniref:Cell division cycle protein 123 n=1 Tax=Candida verbasci TaxID=1227364 RepID=A0A9W4XHV9_9ASCO|nr:unnamed protein product [Candida verbasci]
MTKEYTTFDNITLTNDEVLYCSFGNWSNRFKQDMYDYRIIKMPTAFISYISSDSIKLPQDQRITVLQHNSDNEYSDWEDEEEERIDVSQFQEFHDEVVQAIKEFGKVIPKLNWSSPKDSKWIMPGNTLKCDNVNDVYLLLNSSDHIADDLDYPFSATNEDAIPVEYDLILKKWIDINPALEFRLFIKDEKILGVTQRDLQHYQFLQDIKEQLRTKIHEFVYEKVIPKMKSQKFILDIYIPRPFNKVYIIDINPFSRKSDDLLYTWNELLKIDTSKINENDYEFRLITENNLGSFARKEYSESQVPIDVVGASMDSEAMIELVKSSKFE